MGRGSLLLSVTSIGIALVVFGGSLLSGRTILKALIPSYFECGTSPEVHAECLCPKVALAWWKPVVLYLVGFFTGFGWLSFSISILLRKVMIGSAGNRPTIMETGRRRTTLTPRTSQPRKNSDFASLPENMALPGIYAGELSSAGIKADFQAVLLMTATYLLFAVNGVVGGCLMGGGWKSVKATGNISLFLVITMLWPICGIAWNSRYGIKLMRPVLGLFTGILIVLASITTILPKLVEGGTVSVGTISLLFPVFSSVVEWIVACQGAWREMPCLRFAS